MDGTQRYCQDTEVSVEDITFLILSEIVQSENMGEIKREGFVDGWSQVKYVGVNTPNHYDLQHGSLQHED
jgi:hypothetical protein